MDPWVHSATASASLNCENSQLVERARHARIRSARIYLLAVVVGEGRAFGEVDRDIRHVWRTENTSYLSWQPHKSQATGLRDCLCVLTDSTGATK